MNDNFLKLSIKGNEKELEQLLSKEGSSASSQINEKDSIGYSSLATAVALGHTGIVSLFLKYNADVNTQDERGNTPLHYAAEKNFVSIAEMLLHGNARLDIENAFGNQPLWVAVFSATDGDKNKFPLVKLLVDAGADPNHKNKAGISPWDFANKVGVQEIITILKKDE